MQKQGIQLNEALANVVTTEKVNENAERQIIIKIRMLFCELVFFYSMFSVV